ncbi:MAG: UDP-N-acetylglucosamine 4,6-dehydratase (inverting) [Planctomycetota bacterium]
MTPLSGKSVLITGGTGSFGKACVKRLLDDDEPPRRLVVFSRDEQKHVDMARNLFPVDEYPQIRYFVGDVRDLPRLERALCEVDCVIHAAAMKHVDQAEYNPQECIRTNIGGAENVISACLDSGVGKVVALSTDKAASPINLYGATKLCSDKLFTAANALGGKDGTRFAVVRYGNVLGSNGSVLPFFLRQRLSGTLPITDPRMTRFWITLEMGVDLVLRAFDLMRGGEIFVPKIPSMKVIDLAKAVDPDCKTRIVGIRPGEKLHECLIPADEARQTVEFDEYLVIEPAFSWWNDSKTMEQRGGKRCPDGFAYTSDTNPDWLDVAEITALIEPFANALEPAS